MKEMPRKTTEELEAECSSPSRDGHTRLEISIDSKRTCDAGTAVTLS
jgi:hypothetical protein